MFSLPASPKSHYPFRDSPKFTLPSQAKLSRVSRSAGYFSSNYPLFYFTNMLEKLPSMARGRAEGCPVTGAPSPIRGARAKRVRSILAADLRPSPRAACSAARRRRSDPPCRCSRLGTGRPTPLVHVGVVCFCLPAVASG